MTVKEEKEGLDLTINSDSSKVVVRKLLNHLLEAKSGDREQIIHHCLDTLTIVLFSYAKQIGGSVDDVVTELLNEMKERKTFNPPSPTGKPKRGRKSNEQIRLDNLNKKK